MICSVQSGPATDTPEGRQVSNTTQVCPRARSRRTSEQRPEAPANGVRASSAALVAGSRRYRIRYFGRSVGALRMASVRSRYRLLCSECACRLVEVCDGDRRVECHESASIQREEVESPLSFLLDEARHRQLCDAVLVASTAPTAADEAAMFPPRFAEMAHAMMAIRRFPFAGLTSLLPRRRACRLLQESAKRVRPARWHALTLSLGKSASDANGSASSASLLRRSRERR